MKSVTVLLTCVGGLISPSQIDSLKNNPDRRRVKIIGTDIKEDVIGKYLADIFYKVPLANHKDYINKISEICLKENVDVIFPASNEESLALAKGREVFKKMGIEIAVSDYEVLKLTFNKAEAYSILVRNNLPCAKFFVFDSTNELIKASRKLGFPKKDIVIKPVMGRGGRGTRILTARNPTELFQLEKPSSLYADFEGTIKTLDSLKYFPEMIAMEYLPGEYWSVDFLAKNGKPLIIVPKIRLEGTPSQTLVGQVKKNLEIEKIVKDISLVFNFDYNINIELKYSEDNKPLPYDINPRIAASVAFCTAAGANLIYYGLKIALGEEIPEKIKMKYGTKMIRYLKEYYV